MSSPTSKSAPLTFDVDADTLSSINRLEELEKYASKSAVIRTALDLFPCSKFTAPVDPHQQISVRINGCDSFRGENN